MTKREYMQALVSGENIDFAPQWIMAFNNTELVKQLLPEQLYYDGYSEYPFAGRYPFSSMGEERLIKEKSFNQYIDRCAFPVGWGANAAFGHCGPGEFNKKLICRDQDSFVVEYETGAKKEIRIKPHNVHTFYLPVTNENDLDKLVLPDSSLDERYEGLKQDIKWAKEHDEWTVAWVNGFFSSVHYFLRPYEEFLVDLIMNADFAKQLIKKTGEWTLIAAKKICEAGVDCIGFCDDLGSGQSLLISPEMYKNFIWPWHKRLCDLAHSYGVAVHMHCHGAVMPIIKDIAQTGVDILNPLDPDDYMPIEQVREIVGPRMILCGGMNKHFFDWKQDMQLDYLRSTLDIGRKIYPFILMDSGGIPDNVNKEWFEWFLEVSREMRQIRK